MELKDKDLNLKCWEVARTCVAGNLRRVSRAAAKVYDDALRPSGLRGTQFNLMTAIILMGPVTISKLAEGLVMDRTTLTRNLGPLQKQGLVDISRVMISASVSWRLPVRASRYTSRHFLCGTARRMKLRQTGERSNQITAGGFESRG
jgi:DNA-binding transcriptional ArsR family regulator